MSMNLPGEKPMHEVGQIASHNTNTNSDWIAHLKYVNAVELDVWPLSNWIVSHDFNVGAGDLDGYMKDLADWRENNPDHDLITVFFEIKSKEGWRVPDFESILLRQFNRSEMFSPRDLVKWGVDKGSTAHSLRALVKDLGWPTFSEVKNKIMFVLNNSGDHVVDTYLAERPLRSESSWSTDTGTLPLCFVMSSADDTRTGYRNIVIFNNEYNNWPDESMLPEDRCLRRAYVVKSGNDEMVNGDQSVATNLMINKKINYLCYDSVENAFNTPL
jgi:hypothetical protein